MAEHGCEHGIDCRVHRPTAENMRACRFGPDCRLHTGRRRPRLLSQANYQQMREDAADGLTVNQIARLFDTSRATVSAVLRGART